MTVLNKSPLFFYLLFYEVPQEKNQLFPVKKLVGNVQAYRDNSTDVNQ